MRDRRAGNRRDAVADQAEDDVGVEDRERHLAVRARLGNLRGRTATIDLRSLQRAAGRAADEPVTFLRAGKLLDDDDARFLELDAGRGCRTPGRQIDLAAQSRRVRRGVSRQQLELATCGLPRELCSARPVIERSIAIPRLSPPPPGTTRQQSPRLTPTARSRIAQGRDAFVSRYR